jgi:hypothetical protein
MNRRKEILDELNETAPSLAGIAPQQPPYKVPAGYFDVLPADILSRIKAEKAGSVQEELEIISPVLSGISKKMPFSTPAEYFDTLTPAIRVENGEQRKQARVVRMFQPQRTFRYAAAALIAGVIGVAAWLFLADDSTPDKYAMKPDVEVQKELKSEVSQLSEKEINAFVQGSSATLISTYENSAVEEIGEEDVRLMLADIPDRELEKYLDQNTVKEKFN